MKKNINLNNKKISSIAKYFDSAADNRKNWLQKGRSFHKEDILVLKELINPDSKVLELGCGNGHLLAGLSTEKGVGIDISSKLIEQARQDYPNLKFINGDIKDAYKLVGNRVKFDYIILSDTIGYLEDVQDALEGLHSLCHSTTRIMISYYSPLWAPLLSMATFLGLKMPDLNTTLLTPSDISNFLKISDYESVRIERKILLPFKLLGLGRIINRFIAPLPFISLLCLRHYIVARSLPASKQNLPKSASIIIPCKNEFGNIKDALRRIPRFTKNLEVIFIEGNSKDGTWDEILRVIKKENILKKGLSVKAYKQLGKGKADAVFYGFGKAKNDVLMILDADLTVPPEDLHKFWKKISLGHAEYVNGTRLVYPMDDKAMRFLNYIANKLFSILFTWLLGQRFTDTLCGTKVIRKKDFKKAKLRNKDLGSFDPFGDFFLIFGSSRLSLKIVEVPIRYKARTYGKTQISRFSHGLLLVKMVIIAFFKIKAI